jgi:hypothetical protein
MTINWRGVAMTNEHYEKGRRDGANGIYQPPHQKVYGPRSTYTPKKIDQDRDDYRRGYLAGKEEKLKNVSSEQGPPMRAFQPRSPFFVEPNSPGDKISRRSPPSLS